MTCTHGYTADVMCAQCSAAVGPRTFSTTPPATPHRCPVCVGSGLVSRPPGVAGDLPSFASSSFGPWPCGPCGGTGVLWR